MLPSKLRRTPSRSVSEIDRAPVLGGRRRQASRRLCSGIGPQAPDIVSRLIAKARARPFRVVNAAGSPAGEAIEGAAAKRLTFRQNVRNWIRFLQELLELPRQCLFRRSSGFDRRSLRIHSPSDIEAVLLHDVFLRGKNAFTSRTPSPSSGLTLVASTDAT